MAFTEINIARQAVDSTGETLYTVTSATVIVKDINVVNNGDVDCDISIWLVPNGDSASNENVLVSGFTLPGRDIFHWSGFQALDTVGDFIFAQSEISDQVTISISGAIVS